MRKLIISFIEREFLPASAHLGSAQDDLLTGGIINSLGLMRLIAFLEKQYEIRIPFEDITLDHFNTLDSITKYLAQRHNLS